MDKKYESLHQNLKEAIDTQKRNNIPHPKAQSKETDSIIRRSSNNQTPQEKAEATEQAFYGAVRRRTQRAADAKAKRTALLKLGFLAGIALLVLSVAISQNSPLQEAAPAPSPEPAKIEASSSLPETLPAAAAEALSPEPQVQEQPEPPLKEASPSPAQADKQALRENLKSTAAAAANFSWQLPAAAKISRAHGYSFDQTWQDYRFHSGIDLSLAVDSEFLAPAKAVVTEINKTKALGQYIRLDYGSNLVACYYGLSLNPELIVGDNLEKGELIGTVCEPPLIESAEEPHCHFTLMQNNQAIDPAKYQK